MSMPAKSYKLGKVEVSIWKSDKFENSYSFKFQKSYMDKEKKWQHTDYFGESELSQIAALCNMLIGKKISDKAIKQEEKKPVEDESDIF